MKYSSWFLVFYSLMFTSDNAAGEWVRDILISTLANYVRSPCSFPHGPGASAAAGRAWSRVNSSGPCPGRRPWGLPRALCEVVPWELTDIAQGDPTHQRAHSVRAFSRVQTRKATPFRGNQCACACHLDHVAWKTAHGCHGNTASLFTVSAFIHGPDAPYGSMVKTRRL